MIIKDRIVEHTGNHQVLHRFDNGYGASVIQGPYTYGGDEGLFEMAVVHFDGDEYTLVYDTPVTDDVLGYLTPEEVDEALARIEALPEGAVVNNTVRGLVDSFRREHPFTHLPHEVLDLLEAAYEAGRNSEAIEQWTREVA